MTLAEMNKQKFVQFLDEKDLKWDYLSLWEILIYPSPYQRANFRGLLNGFGGTTVSITQRYYNTDVWIVELPRIIVDTDTDTDTPEYRDDCPQLTGEKWEEAMDKLGHNVTSHLNEQGPCVACDKEKPMNILDKIRDMKMHEIVTTMIESLEEPTVEVDMSSFGHTDGDKCFGCAYTNFVGKVCGPFTVDNIANQASRADALHIRITENKRLEYAMDYLRKGALQSYNDIARILGLAVIPKHMEDIQLPYLGTDTYRERLHVYRAFATLLKHHYEHNYSIFGEYDETTT